MTQETIWARVKRIARDPFVIIWLAIILISLGSLVYTTWPSVPFVEIDCADLGGAWDDEKNTCLIISECLDKGGCYPIHDGTLPKDRPFCLFGKDIKPNACYDSEWLRKYLTP